MADDPRARSGSHDPVAASPAVDRLTPAQAGLHRNFVVSVKALRTDLVRAAFYLLQVRRRHIHRILGFGTIGEYGAAVGGLTPRQCRDLLTLARRLPDHPDVRAALESGTMSWSRARRICGGPDRGIPSDMSEALDGLGRGLPDSPSACPPRPAPADRPTPPAAGHGAKDAPLSPTAPPAAGGDGPHAPMSPAQALRLLSPVPGDSPPSPIPPDTPQHVTLKLTSEQYSRWQTLAARARRGGDLAEQILTGLAGVSNGSGAAGGFGRSGRSGQSGQSGHSGDSGDSGTDAARATTATRATMAEILLVRLLCPDCGRATVPTSRGEVELPAPLLAAARCDSVVEDESGHRRRTIAPRVRRRVLRRARYRCEIPDCGQAVFLTIHHRLPHAAGGVNDPRNLVVLCWRCHRDLHVADAGARAALAAAP